MSWWSQEQALVSWNTFIAALLRWMHFHSGILEDLAFCSPEIWLLIIYTGIWRYFDEDRKFLGRQKVDELVGTPAGFVVRPVPLGINTLPRDISLREIGTFPIESTPSKYLCPLVLHLHPCHTLPWLKNLTAEIIAEQQLSSPGKMLNLYVPHPYHWIRELWNFLAWIGL